MNDNRVFANNMSDYIDGNGCNTNKAFSGTPTMNIITPNTSLQNEYILKAQNEQNNTSDAKGKDC